MGYQRRIRHGALLRRSVFSVRYWLLVAMAWCGANAGAIVAKVTRVVLVRWFDAAITHGETCRPEDVSGILENESAGLLVAESKDSITLAMDRCIDTGNLRGTLCIPKVNIRRVYRFKAG